MAAGKPVVGTKVGGTPEIIDHWGNGLLVPPRDPEALARAIISVMSDSKLVRDLGTAGRRTVRDRFTIDRMVDETLAVYYRVLFAKRRLPSAEAR
jgi:glycosyltransferase involved in cell wall biosynthesis